MFLSGHRRHCLSQSSPFALSPRHFRRCGQRLRSDNISGIAELDNRYALWWRLGAIYFALLGSRMPHDRFHCRGKRLRHTMVALLRLRMPLRALWWRPELYISRAGFIRCRRRLRRRLCRRFRLAVCRVTEAW
ncbi:hypothetical protein KCP73_19115 [Salmonella enterica subsp. enterica]|nr:hypothetical protein KCP73_19115 [Salmonella enterica subsp. enterica]